MLDFVVEDMVIVSVVPDTDSDEAHKSMLNNYLRLTGIEIGLLVNFNAEKLRDGIKRLIVSSESPHVRYQKDA